MNTPVHALIAVTLLDRGARSRVALAALAGGVTPDLPAAVFFGWFGVLRGRTDLALWTESYVGTGWELAGDVVHSFPLFALVLAAGFALRSPVTRAFAGGALLHALLDLPTHADDAHRHFLPLSEWRFVAPWSFWDLSRGAAYLVTIELAILAACVAVCRRRYRSRSARVGLLAIVVWTAIWLGSGVGFWSH